MKALRKLFVKLASNPYTVLAAAAAVAALVIALGYGDSSYYKFAAPRLGDIGKIARVPGLGDIGRINGLPGWGDIARIFN